ncbi:MAG: hypothetical protein ACPLXL_01810 [Minisyncoccia bacterium]
MKKDFLNSKIFFFFLIVLIALLGYLVYLNMKKLGEDRYYAVYLRTGDLYFGKISWFPKFSLNDVWLLQRSVDQNNQVSFSLVGFTEAVYMPVDRIDLNKDNVVWITQLDKDSPVIQEIKARRINKSPLPSSQVPVTTTSTSSNISPSEKTK